VEDFKHKQREEIRSLLVDHSRACEQRGRELSERVRERVAAVYPHGDDDAAENASVDVPALGELLDWARETFDFEIEGEEAERLGRAELQRRLLEAVDERHRPEMRRMERAILLQITDSAWKDHLLSMDHLRSSIGLMGYAQVDPKVEYKREGMKLFESMWDSIGERVSDLIFKMEQLDEGFVGGTWVETAATHAQAETASDIAREQEAAINSSKGEVSIETIRNRGPRVKRNDPCPCGSGKKYKNCCMRRTVA
jgi:preprotein translocase subunit SecA